jgi:hypothetical protein
MQKAVRMGLGVELEKRARCDHVVLECDTLCLAADAPLDSCRLSVFGSRFDPRAQGGVGRKGVGNGEHAVRTSKMRATHHIAG